MRTIAPALPVPERRFFAFWVQSRPYAAARLFKLDPHANVHILLTEGLTGCSFVVLPVFPGAPQTVAMNAPVGGQVINLHRLRPYQPGPGVAAQPVTIQCGHVQCGNLGSENLHDALLRAFPAHVDGRRDYGHQFMDAHGIMQADRTVSIVGVKGGTQWQVYAQKLNNVGPHYEIRSVYRIYPPPREKL